MVKPTSLATMALALFTTLAPAAVAGQQSQTDRSERQQRNTEIYQDTEESLNESREEARETVEESAESFQETQQRSQQLRDQNRDAARQQRRAENARGETTERVQERQDRSRQEQRFNADNAARPERGMSQRTELPQSLQQLNLKDEQKQQILAIYRKNDRKAQQLWERVQDLHRQAISMEAAVIAAARLEGHDHSAHAVHRDDESQDQSQQTSTATASTDDNAQARTTLKPVNKGDSPESAFDDQRQADRRQRTGNQNQQDQQNDRRQSSAAGQQQGWQDESGTMNIVAIRVGVAEPNGRIREYLLTQPAGNQQQGQQSQTCEICQAHQTELMNVWSEIHKTHEQLVELEASSIVEVEKHLTQQQLDQLSKGQEQQQTGQQQDQTSADSNQQ